MATSNFAALVAVVASARHRDDMVLLHVIMRITNKYAP